MTSKPLVVLLLAFVVSPLALAACSSKEDDARNGVDDVRKACEIRAAWPHPLNGKCIACQVAAKSPSCDCEEFKEFAGLCRAQEEARLGEPSCKVDISTCEKACALTDCGCIEGCYAQAEACKRATAAKDGCLADVCTPYCQ